MPPRTAKRVLSSLLFLLALIPLLLLTRWNSEAKAPWSLPEDGARARLTAPRFLWRPGDVLELELRLKSHHGFRGGVPAGLPIELVVRHEGRETERFGPVSLAQTDRLEIDPDEHARLVLPFVPILGDGPGLYSISGRVGAWELRPLKVRALKAKTAPAD
jgi:hypothetical protein